MPAHLKEAYMPSLEFEEDAKDPLVDLSLNDSTELWLIQWPKNQNPDFDGQELTLKLHHDGNLGSFKGSSGKEYDVVSFAAQEPNATVFVSSASGTKIAGKISRRVSLVHYSEPHELEKLHSSNLKQMYQKSSSITMTKSSHQRGSPAQSYRRRNSGSASGRAAASSHSSRHKSSLSDVGEPSTAPSKSHVPEPSRSNDHSTQNSGRASSAVTSSGSFERSHQGKSKKKKIAD
ncbi:hypothetical protein L484_019131 [Morus notabilis]|uniref:Mediator-associated protein 2 n=1 Tax=Morus notabilis TaxID=981085 RepID=W9SLQ0_9ROSA|nr:mediator-associated protein 2 [Morus notabilis]XP_024032001.1 mediator-associated protein 2 [Morus notabilis]XP_024032002.1 mediator-associated protein 2 [Morus notabilis]EXC34532.1 hypothetical protein L484_019131 [Morus notabilis]